MPEGARQAAIKFIILRCRELQLNALCLVLLFSDAIHTLPNAYSLLRTTPEPWMALIGLQNEYTAGRLLAEFSLANFR